MTLGVFSRSTSSLSSSSEARAESRFFQSGISVARADGTAGTDGTGQLGRAIPHTVSLCRGSNANTILQLSHPFWQVAATSATIHMPFGISRNCILLPSYISMGDIGLCQPYWSMQPMRPGNGEMRGTTTVWAVWVPFAVCCAAEAPLPSAQPRDWGSKRPDKQKHRRSHGRGRGRCEPVRPAAPPSWLPKHYRQPLEP